MCVNDADVDVDDDNGGGGGGDDRRRQLRKKWYRTTLLQLPSPRAHCERKCYATTYYYATRYYATRTHSSAIVFDSEYILLAYCLRMPPWLLLCLTN